MAKFKDMRQFVQLVYDRNVESAKAYKDAEEDDEVANALKYMERNEAILEYAVKYKVSEEYSQEVYEDTVNKHFEYIKPMTMTAGLIHNNDKVLRVTTEGRHFLRTFRGFQWGLWVEFTKDSNALLSLLSGVVLSSVFWALVYGLGGKLIEWIR